MQNLLAQSCKKTCTFFIIIQFLGQGNLVNITVCRRMLYALSCHQGHEARQHYRGGQVLPRAGKPRGGAARHGRETRGGHYQVGVDPHDLLCFTQQVLLKVSNQSHRLNA